MEPLSCNYNLTKDKVERAIELHQRELEILNDNLDSDERNNWELRDYISAYKTALAALDAVRWRDVNELPEDGQMILVCFLDYAYDVGLFRVKSDDSRIDGKARIHFDAYGFNYWGGAGMRAWMPLPKWEEEAINRAFDDDHGGIGLTD
jgi:hypothetical protein